MKFDEEGFRADLLAGNWSEWLIDEVVRRLEPYLTPDEDEEVLVEGSYFKVSELPTILGNFIRSNVELSNELKVAYLDLDHLYEEGV